MSEPLLRLNDGFPHTSPQLRDQVRELQAVLRRHDRSVAVDGLFDPGTEYAVRDFQRHWGLREDGVVGPETWQTLIDPQPPQSPEPFSTSYPLDHPILLEDLEAAARYGAEIEAAASELGLSPAVIVALGSRESRWGLALMPRGAAGTSDFAPRLYAHPQRSGWLPDDGAGFRRGLMQLDWDTSDLARSGDWRAPGANIREACRILREARAVLRRRTVLHSVGLLRGALAAYNCGIDHVLRTVRQGQDLDFYAAGRDYSREVLNRVGFFQAHGWD